MSERDRDAVDEEIRDDAAPVRHPWRQAAVGGTLLGALTVVYQWAMRDESPRESVLLAIAVAVLAASVGGMANASRFHPVAATFAVAGVLLFVLAARGAL